MMNPIPTRTDYHSRPLPTTPDRGYVGGSSRTPSRRDPPPVPSYPSGAGPGVPGGGGGSGGGDWHAGGRAMDDACRRELEEARARTAQMEKTMRWWSDCTANWREKWSRAREERNRARDECRRLRTELDAAAADRAALVQHRDELVLRTKDLESELRSHSLTDQTTNTQLSADTQHHVDVETDNQEIAIKAGICQENVRTVENNHSDSCNPSNIVASDILKQMKEAESVIETEQKYVLVFNLLSI